VVFTVGQALTRPDKATFLFEVLDGLDLPGIWIGKASQPCRLTALFTAASVPSVSLIWFTGLLAAEINESSRVWLFKQK
jgi:hypothetical protein